MRDRVDWIDSAKGFTMLLVIIGHCVDGYLKAHMFPSYTKQLQFIFDFLYSFHMPLFFILSGFLYYYSYNNSNFKKIKTKTIELIALYFGYSIIQCLVQMAMVGKINRNISFSDILLLPVYTVPPYWYLYVLAFLYVISYALRPLNKLKFSISLFLCILSVIYTQIRIFSLSNIAYYLLFFTIVGVIALKRYDMQYKKIYSLFFVLLYFATTFLGYWFGMERIVNAFLLSMIVLTAFCSFDFLKSVWLFNLCGKYCLPIYLLHSYLTAGTRVVLKVLHINNIYLYLVFGIVLGVIIPIILYKFCNLYKCLRWVFKPVLLLDKDAKIAYNQRG